MKSTRTYTSLMRQRITLLLAILFCMFISSVEFTPYQDEITKTEQQGDQPDQTFLKVAVDAVVPFALHIVHSVFHLLYQVFSFEIKLPSIETTTASIPLSWVEILFERIISTKGP
ncbi:hypothetical protein [Algoriphagus mannitolivorans]|uniref:hypothetical protein n=1 Tax=Algoriphagus mannitolivorans TaxID=226504 RepID=UPI0012FBE070|nr:hypothetical protein [Algoriphagus mannitolivorans]